MTELRNKVAVVTGAASGIGRALSIELGRRGSDLALVDIDRAGLEQTRELVLKVGHEASCHPLDLVDRGAVARLPEQVLGEHGRADLLFNNAGVTLRVMLEHVTREDFEWLMGVNLWGPIMATQAFLPHFRQRPEAHIVNVSSVHGLFTSPGTGPYCTSKFALRGFTLSLAQELRGTRIKVSCVHPGAVMTNLVRNARYRLTTGPRDMEAAERSFRKLVFTSTEGAARQILDGVHRNRERILVGADAHLYDLVARAFPTTWQRVVGSFTDRAGRTAQRIE